MTGFLIGLGVALLATAGLLAVGLLWPGPQEWTAEERRRSNVSIAGGAIKSAMAGIVVLAFAIAWRLAG